jgi:hypothetical protein
MFAWDMAHVPRAYASQGATIGTDAVGVFEGMSP